MQIGAGSGGAELRSPVDLADAVAKGRAGAAARSPKEAGEEFEAVFLSAMFNEMLSGVGDGPLGAGPGAGVWRSFLAEEYAKGFAKAGGIGIGAEITRTLLQLQEDRA